MQPMLPRRFAALADYLGPAQDDAAHPPVQLPLADEPHLTAWHEYMAAAAEIGAAAVLQHRLPQLCFPVQAGISTDEAYRAATRRLDAAWPIAPPPFDDPTGIHITLQLTAAGTVPVITCSARTDFERMVRALGARNEPVDVPDSMGACIVGGLINISRVAEHRRTFLDAGNPGSDWDTEYRRYTAQKANFQDRIILLSTGTYAGVPAARLNLAVDDWRQRSLVLRRVHECTHYLTARVLGSMRNSLLDELAADYAGIVAAFGTYDANLATIVLGVDGPMPAANARLRLYLGDPPLDEDATWVLSDLAREAIGVLAQFDQAVRPSTLPFGVEYAVLALFQTPLWQLVDVGGGQALQDRFATLIEHADVV